MRTLIVLLVSVLLTASCYYDIAEKNDEGLNKMKSPVVLIGANKRMNGLNFEYIVTLKDVDGTILTLKDANGVASTFYNSRCIGDTIK